jgi:hypothetical protein
MKETERVSHLMLERYRLGVLSGREGTDFTGGERDSMLLPP